MGAGWYYCPARWKTVDGFAPYDVVWDAWRTMTMDRAMQRLDQMRAIAVTKSGEKAAAMIEHDAKEATGG